MHACTDFATTNEAEKGLVINYKTLHKIHFLVSILEPGANNGDLGKIINLAKRTLQQLRVH